MSEHKIVFKQCPYCHTQIAITKQNHDGKCPFRFCKAYGYNSQSSLNENLIKKYVGKSTFSVDLGDIIHCIDVTPQNELICMTIGYPSVHVVSESEFVNLLQNGYLYIKSQTHLS